MFEPGSFLSLKRTVEHGAMIKRGARGDKKEKPNEPDRRAGSATKYTALKESKNFFPSARAAPVCFTARILLVVRYGWQLSAGQSF